MATLSSCQLFSAPAAKLCLLELCWSLRVHNSCHQWCWNFLWPTVSTELSRHQSWLRSQLAACQPSTHFRRNFSSRPIVSPLDHSLDFWGFPKQNSSYGDLYRRYVRIRVTLYATNLIHTAPKTHSRLIWFLCPWPLSWALASGTATPACLKLAPKLSSLRWIGN